MHMVNECGIVHRAQATYQGPYTDRKMALLHKQPLTVNSSSARSSALYAPSPSMSRLSFLYPFSEAMSLLTQNKEQLFTVTVILLSKWSVILKDGLYQQKKGKAVSKSGIICYTPNLYILDMSKS